MKITCHAKCGTHKFIPDTSSVGAIVAKTGFKVTFSIGDIVFYCPQCFRKAQELAYGLLMVLRDKHVRLEDFFPQSSPKPSTIETIGYAVPNRRAPAALLV